MQFKAGKIVVEVSEPYAEGQPLSPSEAAALNRARKDVIRARLAEWVKKEEKEGKSPAAKEIQKMVQELEENFEWPPARDPVETRVNNLIKERLKKAGQPNDMDAILAFKAQNAELVGQVREAIRAAYS